MFTQEIANRIIFLLSWLNKLGTFPLKVNTNQGYFYVDLRCHFHTLHFWMWCTCYVVIVLPTHMHKLFQGGQIDQLSYTLLIWLAGITCTQLLRVLAFRPHGLCQLFNGTARFQEQFWEKFLKNQKFSKNEEKRVMIFEKCLFACCCICSLVGTLIGLDSFVHPRSPAYTLFELDERFLSWPVYLIANLWLATLTTGIASIFGFLLYILIIYFAEILPIIKNEMRPGKPFYKTSNLLRCDPLTLVTTWRSMEYIVILINAELTYDLLMCIQDGFTTCIVFAVVTLKYHGETSGIIIKFMMIVVTVSCCFGYTAFLHLSSLQYKWSEQTIRSWKREHFFAKKDWLYIKKFKMSCRPFSIGDGRRFLIRPKTVLIFLRSTCRCTFRALLTYKSVLRVE